MTRYLIRNARILGGDPTDLLLADGVIARVGTDLPADDAASDPVPPDRPADPL